MHQLWPCTQKPLRRNIKLSSAREYTHRYKQNHFPGDVRKSRTHPFPRETRQQRCKVPEAAALKNTAAQCARLRLLNCYVEPASIAHTVLYNPAWPAFEKS